jgi:3-dehydroquinate synthase
MSPASPLPLSFQVERQQAYEVHFTNEIDTDLRSWVLDCAAGGNIFILADECAWSHHGCEVLESLDGLVPSTNLISFQGGEESKSWDQAGQILDRLAELHFQRRDLLLLFGGGVTCDSGGLVASLFMRGVPYALIPTTVMAQVDASIGGKVAVNHERAKNLVGSFHQPAGIWIDTRYPKTTSRAERVNGFAEMVKVALLDGDSALSRMEAGLPRLLTNDLEHPTVVTMVREAIRIKLDLLAADPFEENLNRILNLGHAVGHALETAEAYRGIRHGYAVAVGLGVAARLSTERGLWQECWEERVVSLLHLAGLPTSADRIPVEVVWNHLQKIRDIRNGALREVLLRAPGRCHITDDVSLEELHAAYPARSHHPCLDLECDSA